MAQYLSFKDILLLTKGDLLFNRMLESKGGGNNKGSFNTYADLIANIPTPKNGDYCFIKQDENHNGDTWRYDAANSVWEGTIKLETLPRDFVVKPISTVELADDSVTEGKLSTELQTLLKDVITKETLVVSNTELANESVSENKLSAELQGLLKDVLTKETLYDALMALPII